MDAEDSDNEDDDDAVSFQSRRRRGPMSQFFSSDTLPSRDDDFFDSLGGSGIFSYPGEGLAQEGVDAIGNAVLGIL